MFEKYSQEFDLELIYKKLIAPLPAMPSEKSVTRLKCIPTLEEIQDNLVKLDKLRINVK